MKREQNIVGKYYRLDKIYANFECFTGIIADYEYEMAEWIKDKVILSGRQVTNTIMKPWIYLVQDLIPV